MPSENLLTKVLIARRFCGAVAITEKSRRPSRESASVRGMGVAVRVRPRQQRQHVQGADYPMKPWLTSFVLMLAAQAGAADFDYHLQPQPVADSVDVFRNNFV